MKFIERYKIPLIVVALLAIIGGHIYPLATKATYGGGCLNTKDMPDYRLILGEKDDFDHLVPQDKAADAIGVLPVAVPQIIGCTASETKNVTAKLYLW